MRGTGTAAGFNCQKIIITLALSGDSVDPNQTYLILAVQPVGGI
jgi:hypothetical protein